MELLGLPTPPNRKHLLDFRNFPKALGTHPRISSFFPNHGVGSGSSQFYGWLSVQQLLGLPFTEGSLGICLFPPRRGPPATGQGGEADKSADRNTAERKAGFLARAGFLAFLVVVLALLRRMKTTHFRASYVSQTSELSPQQQDVAPVTPTPRGASPSARCLTRWGSSACPPAHGTKQGDRLERSSQSFGPVAPKGCPRRRAAIHSQLSRFSPLHVPGVWGIPGPKLLNTHLCASVASLTCSGCCHRSTFEWGLVLTVHFKAPVAQRPDSGPCRLAGSSWGGAHKLLSTPGLSVPCVGVRLQQ